MHTCIHAYIQGIHTYFTHASARCEVHDGGFAYILLVTPDVYLQVRRGLFAGCGAACGDHGTVDPISGNFGHSMGMHSPGTDQSRWHIRARPQLPVRPRVQCCRAHRWPALVRDVSARFMKVPGLLQIVLLSCSCPSYKTAQMTRKS